MLSKRLVRGLSALLMAAVIAGCGLFSDRSNNYRNAVVVDRLAIPDDIDAPAIQDLYPVSEVERIASLPAKYEVPQPETFVNKSQSEVRAFRAGNQYWIAGSGSPAEAWARVRRFWELNDIQLESEIPSQGVMETVWLSRNVDGKSTNDKFRIRVEHGMHENSCEVYVMHLGYPEGAELPDSSELDWSKVKEDNELALAIMQELATYFIETEYEGASASLLAQSFVGTPKSSLETDDLGQKVLVLKLDYDRAWDIVGKAIEEANMQVSDKDRSAGSYYVSYDPRATESKKRSGFFSFLRFGGRSKSQLQDYLVELRRDNEEVVVAVSVNATKNKIDLSDSVLATIQENLI